MRSTHTNQISIFKKILLVVSLFVVIVGGFIPLAELQASEVADVGNTTSWITGYDSSSGKILGFSDGLFNSGGAHYASDTLVRNLMEKGMTEDAAKAAAAEVHSSLYPLIQAAAQKYDLANSNGANVGTDDNGNIDSEILKWADGADFDGKQENLNNYKEYLKAQSALFTELLKVNEKHPGSLPDELTPEHMLRVIGSNYDIVNAIDNGDITASMTGDETVAGSEGVTFIDGVFSTNRYSSRTDRLPSDIVRFVDQAQNIPQETREAVKQASAIQCYRGGLEVDIVGCLAIGSYNILLKGSSLILALVGMVFNMSLNFTLNIGELFNNPTFGLGGSTGAIYIGWSTVRNFINVIFIFVLLYVAISTIIQNDKYGAKKMVTKIVIAALLINFSLFFSKAIIDLSNILALQFYARILESAKSVNGGASGADTIDGGLSSAMLNAIGLESMWTAKGEKYSPENNTAAQFGLSIGLDAYQLLALSIFGGGFILVFALVLFVAIAQFLMRTIVLLFLMITSPFGFIGEAIPALGGVASDWRKRLTNNAIFAPAYMAVLFVICQIMFGGARGDVVGGGNFANLLIGTEKERVGSIGIFFWFLLMMGLLLTGQGAARGFADKFGKGFVDKAEDAFKGKGKYGWRKGASWTGSKIGAGAKASARWTGGKVSEGLRRTPGLNAISKILPQKTRDAWYQAGVDRAKDKANNLRRDENESDEKYEARQAEIIGKAQERQFKSIGLNRGDFENKAYSYTEGGVTYTKYKYGAINKDVAKRLKAKGQEKFLRSRRKRRNDSIERLEGAFGPAKSGSSDDVKNRLKKAKDDLAALKTSTHDAVTVQLENEVKAKNSAIETIMRNGGTVTKAERDDLKNAKKDLADHLAQQNKLEKDIAELSEKLEKVKKEEKDKAEKDKEKGKKK